MNKYILIILAILFTISCKDTPENETELHEYGTGAYIICEGNYTANNGEISFYNLKTDETFNNLFYNANDNKPLGDVIQSMIFCGEKAYISVNNSKKIEVVNATTFEHIAVITGVNYPRYLLKINDEKIYLTNGSAPGNIFVINSLTNEIEKSIEIGNMPENSVLANNKVYVTNGAWGNDSTISIINAETDILDTTIFVGHGATDIVTENTENLWVLCGGKVNYDENWNIIDETESKIVKVNTNSFSIEKEIIIGQTGDDFNPMRLAINQNEGIIYYAEKDGIYSYNINTAENPIKIISGTYYGLEINPSTGNIYVFSDNAFSGAGTLNIYDKDGTIISANIKTGIGPNGAVFK